MVRSSCAAMLLASFAMFGCYHATIDTGLTPSTEVIEQSFASCWIYGLVPPSPVSTMAKCTHGVAKVETQQSFVNGLVGIITAGIYTPMEIKVTCAAGSSSMIPSELHDIVLDTNASDEQVVEAFSKAADLAVMTGKPVFVKY
jgi:hypothetical protein